MTDVLTTHSTAFELEPPFDDKGRPYDSPLGDDLGRFLVSRITSTGDRFQFGDVVREDSWSTCDCEIEGAKFYLVFSYFPVDDRDDRWVIQFGQRRGLLWFLTESRPDLLDQLITAVERVLRSETAKFAETNRLSENEFLSQN